MKLQDYKLEITVFFSGAVVMIFELVGSRILAPYFGNSLFIWTSIIGVILGSLSYGYYLGGKLADEKPSTQKLGFILLSSALSIAFLTILKEPILIFLQKNISDIRAGSIIGSLILFLPTSLLLGMVSPYATRLKIKDIQTSGKTVGTLYAVSTLGSIVGTFFAGFYLIPFFGTNKLLIILSATLILTSLLLSHKNLKPKLITFFLLLLIWTGLIHLNQLLAENNFYDIDTAYSRVWIYNRKTNSKYGPAKVLQINAENHSSMYLESDELVNVYTKYYHLIRHFKPNFQQTLMIGGGGYSFPRDYLKKYPQAKIDVVEIDPEVTKLAKKHFRLKPSPRLNIYHQDGRVFLNQTQKTYDAILIDAFSTIVPPYQLTTKEAIQKQFDLLKENGVVILNLVSAIESKKGKLFRAEYATYQTVFPQVYAFPLDNKQQPKSTTNIILVALKSSNKPSFTTQDPKLDSYLENLWQKPISSDLPVLTDNHAPVEYYAHPILQARSSRTSPLLHKLNSL